MARLAALFMASASAISPVWAASSAGDLLAACSSAPQTQGDVICNAYLNGFVNGIFLDQIAREGGQPICIDNTDTGAVRGAITKFLKDHPAVLAVDAGSVIGAAFQSFYPCRK